MVDPFATHLGVPAQYRRYSHAQERRARDVRAYFDGLAMPGLVVVDHQHPDTPPVIGQDGQELTWERRQQLAAERRLSAQHIDLDLDYRQVWEDVEEEGLGRTGNQLLPPLRIIRPKSVQ